jgi:hypothetical protein
VVGLCDGFRRRWEWVSEWVSEKGQREKEGEEGCDVVRTGDWRARVRDSLSLGIGVLGVMVGGFAEVGAVRVYAGTLCVRSVSMW